MQLSGQSDPNLALTWKTGKEKIQKIINDTKLKNLKNADKVYFYKGVKVVNTLVTADANLRFFGYV